MARYIQILCLSTLNLINQRNVSHIKLSKYCDIDARLMNALTLNFHFVTLVVRCTYLIYGISNICRRAHFHLRNIGRIRMLLLLDSD